MPFDWMHVQRPAPAQNAMRDQFVRAIRERAQLFFNLGYAVEDAVARIRAGLDWEFDVDVSSTVRPDFYDNVGDLVGEVYARNRPKG